MPQPLEPEKAADLRAWADEEREQSPALAEVLEDIAANGLPEEDDGLPWEQVRDAHYTRLGIVTDAWHVA